MNDGIMQKSSVFNLLILVVIFLLTIVMVLSCSDNVNTTSQSTESKKENKPITISVDIVASDETQKYDLSEGEYLIALLSMTCEDCQETVLQLNKLSTLLEMPQIVGLLFGSQELLEPFKQDVNPQFPVVIIDPDIFFTLIGSAPPRLIYSVNGSGKIFWDEPLPEDNAIIEEINRLRRKGNI